MLERILEPEVMDTVDDAREYDRMDHGAVNQRFVDDFLPLVRERRDALVLDLGTGTARIPIALCQTWPGCRVVAVDMAVEMLVLAGRNIAESGLQERITVQQANARSLPFADRSFELVISNSLMHHLPDPHSAFVEMCRVASPGGVIFVRDLIRPATAGELESLVQQYAASETPMQRQLFADSLHASLTVDEVRRMVQHLPLLPVSVSQTSDRHWTLAATRAD